MKRTLIVVLIIVVILGVLLFFVKKDDRSKVCFDDDCFVVEVVDTPTERETGLMYREEMDKKNGMLFIFETPGNYPFWMKNTLIPLDIIWIDLDGKVVDIKTALPCKTDPCEIIDHEGSAKYVLEINSGLAEKYDISIGANADISI